MDEWCKAGSAVITQQEANSETKADKITADIKKKLELPYALSRLLLTSGEVVNADLSDRQLLAGTVWLYPIRTPTPTPWHTFSPGTSSAPPCSPRRQWEETLFRVPQLSLLPLVAPHPAHEAPAPQLCLPPPFLPKGGLFSHHPSSWNQVVSWNFLFYFIFILFFFLFYLDKISVILNHYFYSELYCITYYWLLQLYIPSFLDA